MNWNKFKFLNVAFFILMLASFQPLHSDECTIVFVHIGETLPPYVSKALLQARKFNKDCPIVLIANKKALQASLDCPESITYINCESLTRTLEHRKFADKTKLNDQWKTGFWRYTSERFLYLHDFMQQYGVDNVFHLENDNMLYVDLQSILTVFQSKYKGIAGTFDNDDRCIPGFIYIKNPQVMELLAKCFVDHAKSRLNDIETLVRFRKEKGTDFIDNLPVITEEYCNEQPMRSISKHCAKDKKKYCLNISSFQSIFDAAALGQFLGGTDASDTPSKLGFINESCLFNPSKLTFEWIVDAEGRRVPFMQYSGKKFRINNLHIHSKNLMLFAS